MKTKRIFRILALVLTGIMALSLFGCGKTDVIDGEGDGETNVGGSTTGKIIIELYPEFAPKTVENFLMLVNSKFYDGLTFHRVVDGFMAQGGDPSGDGSGGSPDKIFGEFAANGFTQNTLKHEKGVISMARRGDSNDSASSQFFICYNSNASSALDGSYAAFGKVVEGMDVVEDFCNVERTANSMGEIAVPVKPITMTEVKQLTDYTPEGGAQAGHSFVQMTVIFFK